MQKTAGFEPVAAACTCGMTFRALSIPPGRLECRQDDPRRLDAHPCMLSSGAGRAWSQSPERADPPPPDPTAISQQSDQQRWGDPNPQPEGQPPALMGDPYSPPQAPGAPRPSTHFISPPAAPTHPGAGAAATAVELQPALMLPRPAATARLPWLHMGIHVPCLCEVTLWCLPRLGVTALLQQC